MVRRRRVGRRSDRSSTSMAPRRSTKKSSSAVGDSMSEHEERRFARPDKISPHLFCVICSEVFKNPHRAPCGHSYCLSCIAKWMETAKVCPVDRKKISMDCMHHDFILESIIGDYTVACPWRSSGCSYVGPLCQLDSHKKICVMNPDHLPEVLRTRMKENIKSHSTSGCIPSSSLTLPLPPVAINTSEFDDTVNDDDEGDLPPAPAPSLVMRLFQNSNESSRNLLCNFLSGNLLPEKRTGAPVGGRSKRGNNS